MTALLVVATLGLSGCAASDPAYSLLERDAEASDALPEALPEHAGGEVDLSSARFVGEHDGSDLWLLRDRDQSDVCLLAYADGDAWVLGCSIAGAPLGVGGLAGTFDVVADGQPGPDGAIQISENVYGY